MKIGKKLALVDASGNDVVDVVTTGGEVASGNNVVDMVVDS